MGALERAFQSTRPVWGVTWTWQNGRFVKSISIHTPRVGRDDQVVIFQRNVCISIHTPRVGRDLAEQLRVINEAFQSTRPVWGVTALL